MKIVEFFLITVYGENGPSWSWSRNFCQAGAGAAQKWTGSAKLFFIFIFVRIVGLA
jgi:hypothetical protein